MYKLKLKAQLVYRVINTVLLSRALCLEALTAVNGSVAGRLESKLCLAAAFATSSDKVLTLASFSILFLVAASLAALGLILKALLSVESLFTGGEYELLTAISAGKSDVLVYYLGNLFRTFNFYFVFAHCFLPHFDVVKSRHSAFIVRG